MELLEQEIMFQELRLMIIVRCNWLYHAAKSLEIITDSRTGQIIESGGRTLVTASKEQILTG